ncbi:MAG: DUF2236 domain-containing protein [Chromatiaceae bacterium]|nr:MAG: DUF2236 domain-containing protein [Chromatiaceae bacterium]
MQHPRRRGERAAYIAGLDPVHDCQEIGLLLACFEFPWDTQRALELALLRVFGVAKGTPLLVATGELLHRPQKRYDDTVLLLAEVLENGYDHPRGRAALRRINQQHHRHAIPNDEYLYTLSTFIFEPIRWNARFGWRPLTALECQATYALWREIGRRLGIRDIPTSYAAFEQFNLAYERAQFRYAADNHRLVLATRNLMLGWFLPRWLWPLGAPVIHALIDPPMLAAAGIAPAPRWLQRLAHGLLRARARLLARLPPRRQPRLLTQVSTRTYPRGYQIEALGADRGRPT